MKRIIKILFISSLLSSSHAVAQIAVIDPKAIAEAVRQYEILSDQLSSAEDQLRQMTGSRGYSDGIDSVYDRDFEADVGSILEQYGYEEDRELVENQSRERDAQRLGEIDHYLNQTNDRFDELTRLITEVDGATEQKDILDLQARIQAEQTMLQNEQLKIQLLAQQHETESRMQTLRREERRNETWEAGTNIPRFTMD